MIPTHASLPVDQLVISDPIADSYDEFVATMAKDCNCPNTVCAGVLAGGFCDSYGGEPAVVDGFDDRYEQARDEEEEEFPT